MPYKDKEKAAESSRRATKRYALKHPDRVKENQKRHLAKNPEWLQKFKSNYVDKARLNARRSFLMKTYGLTPEQFDELLRSQGYACAICGTGDPGISNITKARQWDVDHCHSTKKVRGLLCRKCNMALGLFNDNLVIIRSALRYLKKSRGAQ